MYWKYSNPNCSGNRHNQVALRTTCINNVKFKIIKINNKNKLSVCRLLSLQRKSNPGRTKPLTRSHAARALDITRLYQCTSLRPLSVYTAFWAIPLHFYRVWKSRSARAGRGLNESQAGPKTPHRSYHTTTHRNRRIKRGLHTPTSGVQDADFGVQSGRILGIFWIWIGYRFLFNRIRIIQMK